MKSSGQLILVILAIICGCSREPFPGEPVEGLELHAWVGKTNFSNAEPIIVSSSFSNASSTTIVFWDSGFWPNTKVELFDSNMNPVTMTEEGLARRRAFSPGGRRDKNVPIHLRPSEVIQAEPFDLRSLFITKANAAYFVQLTYEERQPDHWRGKLRSNLVGITADVGPKNAPPKDPVP